MFLAGLVLLSYEEIKVVCIAIWNIVILCGSGAVAIILLALRDNTSANDIEQWGVRHTITYHSEETPNDIIEAFVGTIFGMLAGMLILAPVKTYYTTLQRFGNIFKNDDDLNVAVTSLERLKNGNSMDMARANEDKQISKLSKLYQEQIKLILETNIIEDTPAKKAAMNLCIMSLFKTELQTAQQADNNSAFLTIFDKASKERADVAFLIQENIIELVNHHKRLQSQSNSKAPIIYEVLDEEIKSIIRTSKYIPSNIDLLNELRQHDNIKSIIKKYKQPNHAGGGKRSRKPSKLEIASAMVHVKWMKRNASWAPKELMVSYDELPDIEKQKDRNQVKAVLKKYRSGITDKRTLKTSLAAYLHEKWRKTYDLQQGKKGAERIKTYSSGCSENINVPYSKLKCKESKAANKDAASAAVDIVFKVYAF